LQSQANETWITFLLQVNTLTVSGGSSSTLAGGGTMVLCKRNLSLHCISRGYSRWAWRVTENPVVCKHQIYSNQLRTLQQLCVGWHMAHKQIPYILVKDKIMVLGSSFILIGDQGKNNPKLLNDHLINISQMAGYHSTHNSDVRIVTFSGHQT